MIVNGSGPCCSRHKKCPGLNIKKKIIQTYQTKYQCEECSIEKGNDFWLYNAVNSFQAIVPYMGQKRGPFYGGVSPSKIGLSAPY
jgi:hypothetical protein